MAELSDQSARGDWRGVHAPLMYADLNPDSRRRYPVEPTPSAIAVAEANGLIAPDPDTFARRTAIIEARLSFGGDRPERAALDEERAQ